PGTGAPPLIGAPHAPDAVTGGIAEGAGRRRVSCLSALIGEPGTTGEIPALLDARSRAGRPVHRCPSAVSPGRCATAG
ncbi:hypothetical protein, partial [Streptomyces sp. IBSBF 2806]|uniref:hypothetical protein n=1 Tax=Streptomyces sp. IBSBF 2806 TaxID=2903529 RepID=UPI002FDBF65B